MTSGPRRIRVACAKCGYDKVRTLEAGDDRTLTQLSASLRCGGCRTWGKSGALSASLVAPSTKTGSQAAADAMSEPHPYSNSANPEQNCANGADETAARPLRVYGACLNCGHNETFKPRWRRGETLESLAREITCPACDADGATGNIQLRAATSRNQQQHKSTIPLQVGASVLATLAWPFEMLGLLIVIPLSAVAVAMGRFLAQISGPLLIGGAVAGGIAAFAGAAYIAAVLIGAALSVPATLVMRAVEHEYQDNVRNSPRGGYYERVDRKYIEKPRQMQSYNRRRVVEKDRD